MAHKGLLKEEYVKKGEEDVIVDPCKGWVDPCEFCDKRFGNWVESNDEVLEKVPTKPGIFMVALKNKSAIEVHNIVLDASDVQKAAYNCVDAVKELVADKKSKVTKSTILCRWMTFKAKSDKDVVTLCAHWFNNGTMPKEMTSWPGMDLVEQSNHLHYSEKLRKWCYPKKDPVWRKAKAPPAKKAECVMECDFEEPCEICDSNFQFSKWVDFLDAVHDNIAPGSEQPGIYQVAVKYGKTREVVLIGYDYKDIKCNVRMSLRNSKSWIESVLRDEKFKNRHPTLEVRWMEIQNPSSDNNCFLYAHWLNAERFPLLNSKMPGEKELEKHKSFVLRVNDQKWCYIIDLFKQARLSKYKSKKHIMKELAEDIRFLHCSDGIGDEE